MHFFKHVLLKFKTRLHFVALVTLNWNFQYKLKFEEIYKFAYISRSLTHLKMFSSSFSNRIEQEDVTSIVDNDFLEGSVSAIETSEAIGRSLEGKIMIDGC